MADTNASRGAKLLQIYTDAMLTNLINIGYRTGLFEAAAADPIAEPLFAASNRDHNCLSPPAGAGKGAQTPRK